MASAPHNACNGASVGWFRYERNVTAAEISSSQPSTLPLQPSARNVGPVANQSSRNETDAAAPNTR